MDTALKMTAGYARSATLHLLTAATGWPEDEVLDMARSLAIADNLVANGHSDADITSAVAHVEVPE